VECAHPQPNSRQLNRLFGQSLNCSELCLLAEEQGLLPLLSLRLASTDETLIPFGARQKVKDLHRAHVIFSLRLTGELFRLLEHLGAAKIETVVIKGPVLSMRCYGDPGVRQYSDLDLIVRTKDIQHATELMLEFGYEPRIPLQAIASGRIPGEYVFRRPDTNSIVELHTEHTFRYHPRRLPLEKVLARKTWVSIDHRQVPTLSIEDELVLICIHAAKHLWERLAWVVDIAALLANNPALNWKNVRSAAGEVGAERMLRVGVQLTAELLRAPLSAEMIAYVKSDPAAIKLAGQIADRLAQGGSLEPGILGRAAFRVRMRGGLFEGLSYLLRLSLSPTEDDWSTKPGSNRPSITDAISRPFRLARKYHPQR
jgi:Uncharacterised nucleotidyltransferase